MAQHLSPPALGTVVTSGFSAGMQAVKSLILDRPSNTPRTWKDETRTPNGSYSANSTAFSASWREIWDLDGSANALGSDATWAATLATWLRADGHSSGGATDRLVRSYHTDYTGWAVGSSSSAMAPAIGRPLPNPPASTVQTGDMKAAERYGATGSVVVFDHRYLTGNGPPPNWNEDPSSTKPLDAPAFWTGADPPGDIGSQAHQAIPLIGFAHAAANSGLRKL